MDWRSVNRSPSLLWKRHRDVSFVERGREPHRPNWETWPAHMTLYPRALDVSKVLEGQVYQETSDMSNESENL